MIDAYIGIGSNLNHPIQQVQMAIEALRSVPQSKLVSVSSLYASEPMGPKDQPNYVNAVVHMQTQLADLTLLDALQAIENNQHRTRERRWGPRTLDLDILLYGQQVIDKPRLQVPHVGMRERNFVLYPLAEINVNVVLPLGETLTELLGSCPKADLERICDRDQN